LIKELIRSDIRTRRDEDRAAIARWKRAMQAGTIAALSRHEEDSQQPSAFEPVKDRLIV
jgi:hypothetical protein